MKYTTQVTDHIRNFSIIAHIDHGKTTLTDRLLRLTETVTDQQFTERMMDSNPIEQERGITIKMAPVRMQYSHQGQKYTLNLIDTPGHVDFGYEVSRSLAACEGAVLLVDATQGIQAQTLSNFEKARELGLTIIPVLNKIDLPASEVEAVTLECMETFGIAEEDILMVSAKTGAGVEDVLGAVIDRIPAPTASASPSPRALVMTSQFHQHKGAIAYVRVVDGPLQLTKLHAVATEAEFQPLEIGIFSPAMKPVDELQVGEVGYVATGIKDIRQIKVGDTLTTVLAASKGAVVQLKGFKEPQPMVYMEVFPIEADDFALLQDAAAKLALHDAALTYTGTHSPALGNGLRMGFLGILHAEIVLERFKREFDLSLLATAPSVTYQIAGSDGETSLIHSSAEMPDPSEILSIAEPMTIASIFVPDEYMGAVMQLVQDRRGELQGTTHIGKRVRLEYKLPLAEIITDFHDTLKSVTSGFASLEYELSGYVPVDAVKLSILINKEPVEALSVMVVREQAEQIGRTIVKKLKEVVPRQLFEVPIQAAIGGKVVARETVKAYRKDVTAKLYGGDVTRRQKLLRKQAKGKKRLKQFGKVELNQDTFMAVLKR